MIRFAILSVLSVFLWACADKPAPVAPAGKSLASLAVPPAPTNLRFDAPTDSSCTVRWDASDGAADYDVNYKPAVWGKWTNEPHRGIRLYNTIHDLEPDTEYRWAVRAENSDGASEWVFGPNFTTLPDDIEGGDSVETDFELPPLDDPLDGWVDTGSPEGDRAALMAIWRAYGQPNWRKWGTGSNRSLKKWEGIKTNEQGRVVEFVLPDYDWSLSFAIPPEIGQLTQLKVLEIGGTVGNLPPEIGNLRRLEYLVVGLSKDGDSTIPEAWGQLGLLKYLRIQCYGCTGSIPASFGNLQSLEHLTIVAHDMAGPLPKELSNLSRLKVLDLEQMLSLSGQIPASFGNLQSLEVLKVTSVNLEGPLPSLAGTRNLKVVKIEKRYHNSSGSYEWPIISTLPASWGRLTNLEEIILPNVEGTLPPEWGQLDKLRVLSLSPGIHGRLPPEWSGMRSLEFLSIVDQEIEGPLPPEWGFMSNLAYVYLNENLIEGPLPSLWSAMKNMRMIDLSFNFIDGPLPPEWGAWTELEVFECEGCGLTGGIPSTWSAHEKIVKLDLSDNELTGPVPDWWDKTPDLRALYLRDNLFTGPFPSSLASVPSFRDGGGWSLDDTGFTGCVPRALVSRDHFFSIKYDNWNWLGPLVNGIRYCRSGWYPRWE